MIPLGLPGPRGGTIPLGRTLIGLALVAVTSAACRQDMHDQPKMKPLRGSGFFADRRSARPLVPGTVARGTLREDNAYYTGRAGNEFLASVPLPLDGALLARGREQFEVFCSPCHGRTGRGDGMVVQRGFKKPPSYHIERLRQAPVGYFYDVMTNGFGAMSDYAGQIPVKERWAIAAYVRALQLSQYAPVTDVPAERRADLDRSLAAPPPEGSHR